MAKPAGPRELHRDLNASAGGWELAFAPLLLGVLGFVLDRAVGTLPVFTVLLAVAAFAAVAWRLLHDYGRRMADIESDAVWARPVGDGS